MINKKIGFIGGGNMANALISGIIAQDMFHANEVFVSDISHERLAHFAAKGIHTTTDNAELAEMSDIIVLSVKPNKAEEILNEIYKKIDFNKIIISIMAGWDTDKLSKGLPENACIIRVMPNTPALIGSGMSVLSSDHNLDDEQLEIVKAIFSSCGEIQIADHTAMDAVTAISGSGPAYVFMFIEALANGGVYKGLHRDVALKLAAQTVLGSAKMVLETGTHPAELKDSVCSPGGTTIEAVNALEQSGFRAAVIDAVIKCADKSHQMTEDLSNYERILEQLIDDIEDEEEG